MSEGELVDAAIKNFLDEQMPKIAFLLSNRIAAEARKMGLKSDTGANLFLQNFKVRKINDNEWELYNPTPYAGFLEYGTLGYFDIYGLDKFPINPDPKKTKPVRMSEEQRRQFPSGAQPFAFYRRVLYNDVVVSEIVKDVLKSA